MYSTSRHCCKNKIRETSILPSNLTRPHFGGCSGSGLPLLIDRGVRRPVPGQLRVALVESRLPRPVNTSGEPQDQRGPEQSSPVQRGHALWLARSHFRGIQNNGPKTFNESNLPQLEDKPVSGSSSGREAGVGNGSNATGSGNY